MEAQRMLFTVTELVSFQSQDQNPGGMVNLVFQLDWGTERSGILSHATLGVSLRVFLDKCNI